MLRCGINKVHAQSTQSIIFRGSLVARIKGDLAEVGPHEFTIRVLNEDGQSIAPDISGGFDVPEGGGTALTALDFGFILPRYGRYTFSLLVDRQMIDSWEIHAVEARTTTEGST